MERVIGNAKDSYWKADQLRIFLGKGIGLISDLHKQVALDLSNAIGFDSGRPGNIKPWWSAEYMCQPNLCLSSAYVSSVGFREPALESEEMRSIRQEMRSPAVGRKYFATCALC